MEAAKVAQTSGKDILSPYPLESDSGSRQKAVQHPIRKIYARNPKIRSQVLSIADGRCECCGELGFICENGDRYLETHHIVGVAERGPDSVDNIIAVCPICHRKAHFAADRVQIERMMLEAIRRRGRRN
jgi:predicted restriction endonuclease